MPEFARSTILTFSFGETAAYFLLLLARMGTIMQIGTIGALAASSFGPKVPTVSRSVVFFKGMGVDTFIALIAFAICKQPAGPHFDYCSQHPYIYGVMRVTAGLGIATFALDHIFAGWFLIYEKY